MWSMRLEAWSIRLFYSIVFKTLSRTVLWIILLVFILKTVLETTPPASWTTPPVMETVDLQTTVDLRVQLN